MENRKKEIAEFYKQVFLDEKLKEKLRKKAKKITNEEDLKKLIREEIMPLTKKYNSKFSEEELIEFEKETREELSDEALKGVSGGLSVNSSVAGGILALALVAGGGMALGQTTYASGTGSAISMQADEKNDDRAEDNKINFEDKLVNEWTAENIRAFMNYLDDLSADHFVDNSEGHGIKDEYENIVNNLRSLKEAIDNEEVEVPDDAVDDLEAYFYFTLTYDDDDSFGYNVENNDSDEDEDDYEAEVSNEDDNDDDDDEVEVSNETGENENEDDDDDEIGVSNEENVDIDFGEQVLEDNGWTIENIIAFNDQLNQTSHPNKQMKKNLRHITELLNEGNFYNLPANVALSLFHHSHALEVESFKEDLRFTPITLNDSNLYKNLAECLNKLPQNYFNMTGAFNDEAPEALKLNLYLACRYLHVTPEGMVCADQDGKDVISSEVVETLVNFSRCNSGYKFDKYAVSHDKLSEVVKFAMLNNVSAISQEQADQWYTSNLELNQSGALNELSPEMKDKLDVFILEGREAGIFPAEKEISVNNEEAYNTGNGQSSSILARVASATVSAVGSTIKGAGKLVGKIFSFWK